MKRLLLLIPLLAMAAAGYLWWQSASAAASGPTASLLPVLTEKNTAGFARATEPDAVRFPRDLGPHDDFQAEWWYYTGNLEAADGRPFGFELAIFRRALAADAPARPEAGSPWRTNQVYMAHFALSDIAAERFYEVERFSRGAAGLAGGQAVPYRVWLEDWSVEEVAPGQVRLFAKSDEVTLDIVLTETLPPVLHGEGGLSPKGPEPGNASYYYSIIQQEVDGTVTVGQQGYVVTGQAWKDHEYSTGALSGEAIGWDWFSLQLDNGGGLMFFEIRRRDGSLEPFSSGSYIAPDGTVTPLALDDWQVEVLDTWTSPNSGAEYPAGWRIHVPQLDLTLEGRPLMADQELNVSTVYWEGAVEYEGAINGAPVRARGYIEMTGYAGEMTGHL